MCDMQLTSHLFCSVSYGSLLFYPAHVKNGWSIHDTIGRLVMKLHVVVRFGRLLRRTPCVAVTCQCLLLSIVFGESHEHDIQCGYFVNLEKSYMVILWMCTCENPLNINRTPVISSG